MRAIIEARAVNRGRKLIEVAALDSRYKLAEGEPRAGRIEELRRVDFTPALAFLRH
jgi:hypothetical protein